MASYTPTRTCNDLATRIADELSRNDLTSQIQLEINSAILYYVSRQLWGTEGSWISNTVSAQRLYIPAVNFRSIDRIVASYNSGNWMFPVEPRTFDFITEIDFGLANFSAYPQYFCYQANQIRFYPPTFPNGSFTVYGQVDQLPLVFNQTTPWAANTTFATNAYYVDTNNNIWQVTAGGGGQTGSSAPAWTAVLNASITDGALTVQLVGTLENFWTTEAEALIRTRALGQIAGRYINDGNQAAIYAEMERQEYLKLKQDNISRGVSTHHVRPTQW